MDGQLVDRCPVIVYLDRDTREEFRRIARERDRSMSSQSRDLIRTFIAHAQAPPSHDPAVDSAARAAVAAR